MTQAETARVRRLVILEDALSHVLAMDDEALTAGEVRLLVECRDVVENIRAQVGKSDD